MNECYFKGINGKCNCLVDTMCGGKCSFFKTEKQFVADRDKAIDICRKKNLCHRCVYVDEPCKKSKESARK